MYSVSSAQRYDPPKRSTCYYILPVQHKLDDTPVHLVPKYLAAVPTPTGGYYIRPPPPTLEIPPKRALVTISIHRGIVAYSRNAAGGYNIRPPPPTLEIPPKRALVFE